MAEGPQRRGHVARGLSDGFSQALELVVVPVLFGLLGALADRWLGSGPVLMLTLAFVGFLGSCLAAYYRYDARMREHEAARLQRGRPRP